MTILVLPVQSVRKKMKAAWGMGFVEHVRSLPDLIAEKIAGK